MTHGVNFQGGSKHQETQEQKQSLLPSGSWWALLLALGLGITLIGFYPNLEPEESQLSPQRQIQSEQSSEFEPSPDAKDSESHDAETDGDLKKDSL